MNQKVNLDDLINHAYDLLSEVQKSPTGDGDWGLWFYDDIPSGQGGGVGSFAWFTTHEELLQFITEVLPFYNAGSSSIDPKIASIAVNKLIDQSSSAITMSEGFRVGLNQALSGLCQVEWLNTFADLMNGSNDLALQVRAKFRDDNDGSRILPSERSDFISFLAEVQF